MGKKHESNARKSPPPSKRARRNTRQGSPCPDGSPAPSIEEVNEKETPEEELGKLMLHRSSSMRSCQTGREAV